jgi:hypothetical protein
MRPIASVKIETASLASLVLFTLVQLYQSKYYILKFLIHFLPLFDKLLCYILLQFLYWNGIKYYPHDLNLSFVDAGCTASEFEMQ